VPPPVEPDPAPVADALPPEAVNSDEAAARLSEVRLREGEGALVVHCAFNAGRAVAVPMDLADASDEHLAHSLIFPPPPDGAAPRLPDVRPCMPEAVLRVPPGSYQVMVLHADRFVPERCAGNAWIDFVEVSAGDRLELYLGLEDLRLDLPCR
jgi:hypothetical protein